MGNSSAVLMTPSDLTRLAAEIQEFARAAGAAIMDVYAGDFVVNRKDDQSPVTEADRRAERVILDGLATCDRRFPVVSEEEASEGRVPAVDETFWLVDPLDGTREFIQRNGEFTVNIALIHRRLPVLGVVFAPALGALYWGGDMLGAHLATSEGESPIEAREAPREGLTVVASRSHGDEALLDSYLAGRAVRDRRSAGSSLKFCLVARGLADLYPRFGTTMEWDTAAGHAVLNAAGGSVVQPDGSPLLYAKVQFRNPHFVAHGRRNGAG